MVVGAGNVEVAHTTNQIPGHVEYCFGFDGVLLAEGECLVVIFVLLSQFVDGFVADEQSRYVQGVLRERKRCVKIGDVCLDLRMWIFCVDFFETLKDVLLGMLL